MPPTATAQAPTPQPYYIPPPPPQSIGGLDSLAFIVPLSFTAVLGYVSWSLKDKLDIERQHRMKLEREIRETRQEASSEVEKIQAELRRLGEAILNMKADLPSTYIPHKTYEAHIVELRGMIKALHDRMDAMAATMTRGRWR